jgi:[CysO sulfur-carrier protein]-S-L-cysteine hydrolase
MDTTSDGQVCNVVQAVSMSEQHPWLDGHLRIPKPVLDEIDAHARAEYPNESCGFLLGPASEPQRISRALRAVNQADRYHKADPETFPRTAHTFYIIDARVIYKTFESGEANGEPVKVIYHSHCDCGAYFSSEDQAAAAPDGVLSYPVTYLVTSIRNGVVDDHKLFSFKDSAWVEVPFTVE